MITAWRLADERYARQMLSGEGGLHASGRWHRRGGRVVYLASTLSLAALEVFVHLRRTDSKIPFVAAYIECPDDVAIESIERTNLPGDWRAEPPPASTQAIGDGWLAAGRTALLRVPSAIVPIEHNFVLNPAHPDASRVVMTQREPFQFDARLWK